AGTCRTASPQAATPAGFWLVVQAVEPSGVDATPASALSASLEPHATPCPELGQAVAPDGTLSWRVLGPVDEQLPWPVTWEHATTPGELPVATAPRAGAAARPTMLK
ncbi:MAG TPA: hypothetical protein VNA65_08985, partial [Candidatus Dormibacteraeota bacterium]|nr:hypothetical protein [Candidatus Dormibacteraeota bacterium]